jgi:hypothetical protein
MKRVMVGVVALVVLAGLATLADAHSLFLTLDTPNPPNPLSGSTPHFGHSVAVGDVTGDGKADIVVGTPEEWINSMPKGRVHVFSGADGSLLFTF